MRGTSGGSLTLRHKALLRAVATAGGKDVVPLRDGRAPWRVERGGPGWKFITFYDLADAGYLTIVTGFMNTPHISLTDAGRAAIGETRQERMTMTTVPKLRPMQMRALRAMFALNREVWNSHGSGLSRPTLRPLAGAGYIELTEYPDGTWKASITQAGRDKVSPPPITPGISLAMFLLRGPDGWATNAENGAEALGQLAAQLDWHAAVVARQGFKIAAYKMRASAERMRGADPDHTHWPMFVRFQTAPGTFLDFIAEWCREQRGESQHRNGVMQ